MGKFYLAATNIFCDVGFMLFGSFFMFYGGSEILKTVKKTKFKLVK